MNNPHREPAQPPSEVIRPPEAIVAAVPKEAFKAMFYLFAGRPDSKTKLLRRRIILRPDDVYHLNDKIVEKLRLHQIDQVVSTATIKFRKQEIIQFGAWAELQDFDWRTAHQTEEFTFRWDFMIKIQGYAAPQRHTLTVKVSTGPNPRDVFQFLMSHDPDVEDLEGKFGLCVARVDFISHQLADELIQVVQDWNEALTEAEAACSWFSKLEKYDSWIAALIRYSLPLLFSIVALAAISRFLPADTGQQLQRPDFVFGLRWLFVSALIVFAVAQIGRALAQRCRAALNEYGTFAPFRLTSGDDNLSQKNNARDRRHVVMFFLNAGIALVLNVVAGVVTWWLLPGK